YMAPEVMAGGSYSPAADRYALGATTYFALTGRELRAASPASVRAGLVNVAGHDLGARAADALFPMLDPSPARRPRRAAAWVRHLLSVVEDPVPAQRVGAPAAGLDELPTIPPVRVAPVPVQSPARQ